MNAEQMIKDRVEAFRMKADEERKQAAIHTAKAEQLESCAEDLLKAIERINE